MESIILKFSGPLQAWGTSSHFEIRHTDFYPSKSAVIGMVAAALGYRRDNEQIRSLNDLLFAVRIDQPGEIIDDYQTAHQREGKKIRTYVTHRKYIEDAVFVAVISSENEEWIKQIGNALKKPYFQLFMGRRSCPVPADLVQGIVKGDPIQLLEEFPWQAIESVQKKRKSARLHIYADEILLPSAEGKFRRDAIVSLSYHGRNYSLRRESSTTIQKSTNVQEHDAFAALGG